MRCAILFAFAAAAQAAAAEDLTITYKVTSDGPAVTATQYYSASKIRTSDGKMDSIMDMAGGRILAIDHKKKEYSEITLAEIEAAMKDASAKMNEAQQKMDEAMKNVPPAMREKMGKMMGGAAAGIASSMTVTKGGTRTVAGYPCQEWTTSMGETMKSDTCNTTALQIPFDPAQFRKFQAMVNPAMMSMMKDMAKATEHLQQIQGIPLAETTSVKVFGRGTTTTKEATEVKKGPIPASAFEVPAGYKKVESPMKKAAAGR
jgi:hypothetical protein